MAGQLNFLTVGLAAALALPIAVLPPTPVAMAAPAVPRADQVPQQARPVPPGQQVTIYLGLKRPERKAMAAIRAVATPSSPQYRQFPSRESIRQQFGASAATVRALTRVAARRGLQVAPDSTGVYAAVTGTARSMARWLGVRFKQVHVPLTHAGRAVMTTAERATLPRDVRRLATRVVTRDVTYAYAQLQLSGVTPGAYMTQSQEQPPQNRGTPQGCLAADQPALSRIVYSINQLRIAYGIDALPSGADVGGATRMAIMGEGEGFVADDLSISQDCFDLPGASFQRVSSPKLTTALPEGAEGNLDVQVTQAVLPEGSQVTVVENGTWDPPFLGWSTVFGLPTQPDVISSSYGQCEQEWNNQWGDGNEEITESVLLRVSLAGTSIFDAAGDSGSSDCVGSGGTPTKANTPLAVDYITSSPYVTSVGGSRVILNSDNTRAGEVVWNDTELAPSEAQPTGQAGAGGGGLSQLFRRPWWQDDAGTGSPRRAVPDLTAHASMVPGWPLAWGGSFQQVSGTSAASPFLASAFAIIAAQERLAGRPPLGPVQPWLYQMRAEDPQTFFDVLDGSNDLYGQGCCTARTGYDEASGLGAPNLPLIASKVPPPGSGS